MRFAYGTCWTLRKRRSVTSKPREDLDAEEIRVLAITRLIEIIGEAAKNISDGTKKQSPDIRWKEIAGTRDRLIHGYFNVDLDILWQITTVDLPVLIKQLEELLDPGQPS